MHKTPLPDPLPVIPRAGFGEKLSSEGGNSINDVAPRSPTLQYFQRSKPPRNLQQLHITLLHGDLTFILLISHESKVSFPPALTAFNGQRRARSAEEDGGLLLLFGEVSFCPRVISRPMNMTYEKQCRRSPGGGVQTRRQIFSFRPAPTSLLAKLQ